MNGNCNHLAPKLTVCVKENTKTDFLRYIGYLTSQDLECAINRALYDLLRAQVLVLQLDVLNY